MAGKTYQSTELFLIYVMSKTQEAGHQYTGLCTATHPKTRLHSSVIKNPQTPEH